MLDSTNKHKWRALVIDFGRACKITEAPKSRTKIDRPWIAPEVSTARSPYTIKSDTYSVGYIMQAISTEVKKLPHRWTRMCT